MVKIRALGKQELDRVYGNIEWSLKHLRQFLDLGYKDRDEFSKPISVIANGLIEVQEAIKRMNDTI
jgi:hypothetical protein